MAKFCFVSFQQPGHMDFGGRGFIKLAQSLKSMGHEVKWYFSVSQINDFSDYAYSVLDEANIAYDSKLRFYLTADHHDNCVRESAKNLEQHIINASYDCLVIDRLCIGAAMAASSAGIPWATVGSDGRKWAKQYNHVEKKEIIGPASESQLINSNDESYWATSPYLNLSFFPRCYYPDKLSQRIPPHSHFLGSGVTLEEAPCTNQYVLVTFGNTMNDSVKFDLVDAFYKKLSAKKIALLVLTGSEDMTKKLTSGFPSSEYLILKDWMPYERAYSGALLAVGHGGTSHVWTGMQWGVPLIVIPSVGDQWFGGYQVERLKIGKIINIANKKNIVQKLFRLNTPTYQFDQSKGNEVLDGVLNDIKIKENAQLMKQKMQAGGGPQAGANLLIKLAASKSPITECDTVSCCC